MDLQKQLEAFIEESDVKEVGNVQKEGFIVEDDRQADYIVKRIKAIRKEKEDVEALAKKALDDYATKVQVFTETKLNPLEYQEQYLLGLLETYAAQRLDGSKKKSIKLIEGTIGFHKRPLMIAYDEPVVLEFMKQHPDIARKFTKTTISLDKTQIRKAGVFDDANQCTLDDVKIPGISAEVQPDSFSVK